MQEDPVPVSASLTPITPNSISINNSTCDLRSLISELAQELDAGSDAVEEIVSRLRVELVTAKELLNPETDIPRVVAPAKIPSMLVELLIRKQKAHQNALHLPSTPKKKRRTKNSKSVVVPDDGTLGEVTQEPKFNEDHGKRRLTEFLHHHSLAPQTAIFTAERIICVPCSWLFKQPSEHAAPKGKTWNYKVHCFGQKGSNNPTKHNEAYQKWTDHQMPSVVYQVVPVASLATSSSISSSSSSTIITPSSPKKRRKRNSVTVPQNIPNGSPTTDHLPLLSQIAESSGN